MGKGKSKAMTEGANKPDKKDPAAKVAKKLRKAGKKALKLVDQPAVSEIAAAAMMAAAAALSEGKGSRGKSGKGASSAADAEAGKLADTLKALAIDVARRTLESWESRSDGGKPKRAAAGGNDKAG